MASLALSFQTYVEPHVLTESDSEQASVALKQTKPLRRSKTLQEPGYTDQLVNESGASAA